MKQYVVIPVAYYGDCEVYETVTYVGKPAAGCHRESGGNKLLQDYLNSGWKIHSVQTAPIPGSGSCSGAAIFQYILESP